MLVHRLLLVSSLVLALPIDGRADEPTPPNREAPSGEHYIGTVTTIGLREAVGLALENNLDLELARAEPAVAAQALREAQGAFDPTLSGSYAFERAERPLATLLESLDPTVPPLDRLDEDSWVTRSGVTGLLPFGLEYSSNYQLRRLESNSTLATLDREWRAQWQSELRFPLLKDLIYNPQNVQVRRSRISREIAHEDFHRQLSEILQQVETTYWELAAARAQQRVAEKSLATAQDLLEQTKVRYEVGVVAKISVTQAEAGVAEREVEAIRAQNRAAKAQDTLLNAVLAPNPQAYLETELIPTDPAYVAYETNLDVAMQRALESRPELLAARKQVEDAEVQLAYAENQRQPSLDLTLQYTVNGLSGDSRPGNPVNLGEGFRSAHSGFFRSEGAEGFRLGGEFSVPLANRSARALAVQRRIELRRVRTRLRREEQRVILEVRNAVRGIHDTQQALEAVERRRIAQEETLRAEQEKLRLGDSTPHDVLEFEEDLAEAASQQINALQAYRIAITALERSQATLLESRGISIETERERF